jgi:RNA polymerase sigma factor (TIGR02999 family)
VINPVQTDVTAILAAASAGDQDAANRLFPLVYEQLRAQAARYLQGEAPGHTLQPTALVHEAYIKLVGQHRASWQDRGHFFAVAAMAMRRILVNHAKAKKSHKRGGDQTRQPLEIDSLAEQFEQRAIDLVALDEALEQLRAISSEQARLVELRFFAGLTVEQAAEALGVSERTVHRDWALARAWLRGEIERRERDRD